MSGPRLFYHKKIWRHCIGKQRNSHWYELYLVWICCLCSRVYSIIVASNCSSTVMHLDSYFHTNIITILALSSWGPQSRYLTALYSPPLSITFLVVSLSLSESAIHPFPSRHSLVRSLSCWNYFSHSFYNNISLASCVLFLDIITSIHPLLPQYRLYFKIFY